MSVTKRKVVWPLLLAVAIGCAGFVFEVGRVKAFPNGVTTKPISAKTILSVPVAAVPSTSTFTLALTRTVTRPDGQSRVLSTLQRFQRSDGTYKLVQTLYDADGKAQPVQTSFGFARLGIFRLDEVRRSLIFMEPQVDDPPGDIERGLRTNQLFAREESVAGITTIVWRKVGRSEADFVEEYRAPSLGGLLIRSVKVTARGREVVEPTAIQIGEPATALFSELLLYPSDYSIFERRVQEVARLGDAETARLMQQFLDRMRQLRP
jgi:hypothetical protein